MKPWLLILLLVPLAAASTQELVADGCTGTACNAAQLTTLDNTSGLTINRNSDGNVSLTPFIGEDDAPITSVNFTFSHQSQAGIAGGWTITFRNSSDLSTYCTDTRTHRTVWTVDTLTPTGCAWDPYRLRELDILLTSGDNGQPEDSLVDFLNASVTYIIEPKIANVSAQSITSTGADIVWNTSNDADATVTYGETTALGSTETDAAQTQTHNISLSGLVAETQYFYNVTSCTVDACETQGPYTFTTAPDLSPTIENLTADAETHSIGWDLTAPANATLAYGTDQTYGTTLTNATETTSHAFILTGLAPVERIYYKVTSCNADGCASTQGSFVTAPPASGCIAEYEETGADWQEGTLGAGDVVAIHCRLEGPLREREDLTVRILAGTLELLRTVNAPRLFALDPEVLYP